MKLSRHPRWLRDPRSWALQFSAGVCLSRALAYFPRSEEVLPAGLAAVAQLVPVWVYGVLWAATAVALMVVAIRGSKPTPLRNGALVAVPSLWAALYLIGAVATSNVRALTGAYLFWCLVGIITCLLIMAPSAKAWSTRGRTWTR